FIHSVEPKIRLDKPIALIDYPAFVPCLAKKKPDGKTVERWELYSRGLELANCFSEETSAGEVKKFFENEKTEKEKTSLVRHNVDEDYWKIFLPRSGEIFPVGNKFPPCSGVAMGLDRLIMLFTNKKTLDGVLPFPME
ncbi:MAG: LysR family transcriptional regulator, partial [Treponema sp.]|nr:LysR family transcriptional regulator [Treponema sp.]